MERHGRRGPLLRQTRLERRRCERVQVRTTGRNSLQPSLISLRRRLHWTDTRMQRRSTIQEGWWEGCRVSDKDGELKVDVLAAEQIKIKHQERRQHHTLRLT